MATGDIIAFQILDTSALPSGGNIDGNGVIARIRLEGLAGNIGGSYDLSKLTGTGASPGWNRAKTYSATNTARDVALTSKIVRQPFPNQTARIEAVVGSDLDIYAYLTEEWFVADTLTSVSIAAGFYTGSTASTVTGAGLTNSSTRAYRMPQISWVGLEPWRRMTSAGLTVEAIIDHHNARDGQPVAAVDFYVSRSGTTSTASTNAMVLSDEVTAPYRPGVFRATVPIGSLSQGEGDLGATIYPWVGNATWDTNSADFETFPCTGTPKLHPVNIDTDGSYAPAGAYISHTGVQIGTPSIVLLSAMGAYVPGTTPAYATIQALMNATRAYNNSGARARAHDDMAAVFAVLPSGLQIGTANWGTGNLDNTTTYPPGLGYFGITREAGSSISNTGLVQNARRKPSRLLLDGVGIFPGTVNTAAYTVITSSTTVGSPGTQPTKAAANYFLVRNCVGTGTGTSNSQVFASPGYSYFIGNTFTNLGESIIASNAGGFFGIVLLHGCTIDNSADTNTAACQSASVIGCNLRRVALQGLATGGAPDLLGRMVHSVRIDTDGFPLVNNVAQNNNTARAIGVRGESWVNVLIRKCQTGAGTSVNIQSVTHSPTAQFSADWHTASATDQPAITNFNMAYITAVGGRFNGPYNEVTNTRILKEMRQIGIAASQMNTKGDLMISGAGQFASGSRTGTFAYRHGNARFGIVTGDTSAQSGSTPGPDSWLGELVPPLSQNNVGYANMFVGDTSLTGTNDYASAGNYAPQAVLLNRIPAGRAATGFDLNGNTRRNDGSGAAGAIERLETSITPDAATFGLVGSAAAFTAAANIVPNAATFGLAGSQAAISATPSVTLAPAAGSFGLVGSTAALAATAALVPAGGSLVLSTTSAAFTVPVSLLVFTPSEVLALNIKAPESAVDWAFEHGLDPGETISVSEWRVSPVQTGGLAVRAGSDGIAGDVTGCIITGGIFRRIYELTNVVTTSFSRVLIRSAAFRIGPVL